MKESFARTPERFLPTPRGPREAFLLLEGSRCPQMSSSHAASQRKSGPGRNQHAEQQSREVKKAQVPVKLPELLDQTSLKSTLSLGSSLHDIINVLILFFLIFTTKSIYNQENHNRSNAQGLRILTMVK